MTWCPFDTFPGQSMLAARLQAARTAALRGVKTWAKMPAEPIKFGPYEVTEQVCFTLLHDSTWVRGLQ